MATLSAVAFLVWPVLSLASAEATCSGSTCDKDDNVLLTIGKVNAKQDCIDISGHYSYKGEHDGTITLKQTGCDGSLSNGLSYTVKGAIATLAQGEKGSISGHAGAYVIKWSNHYVYKQTPPQAVEQMQPMQPLKPMQPMQPMQPLKPMKPGPHPEVFGRTLKLTPGIYATPRGTTTDFGGSMGDTNIGDSSFGDSFSKNFDMGGTNFGGGSFGGSFNKGFGGSSFGDGASTKTQCSTWGEGCTDPTGGDICFSGSYISSEGKGCCCPGEDSSGIGSLPHFTMN
jgi:hypothetical protein